MPLIPATTPSRPSVTPEADRVEPLLSIRDLRVDFAVEGRSVAAVQGVSLSVRPGRTTALVGESGSGKSVTALSVLRLLPPSARVSGEVRFEGRDLAGLDEASLREVRGGRVGMIFQEPMTSLNPLHTIGRQIGEAVGLHRPDADARARTLELLELVGIPDPASRLGAFPHQLSGGQRQRVMIAMALANDPALLIADEPTTALDVTIQAQVLELMKKLVSESESSMMLITHNLGVVAETCDEAVVMYAGQIVEKGSVDHIFNRHSHPYTAGLMASIPSLSHGEGDLYSIPGTVPTIDKFVKGCRFASRCAHKKPGCEESAPPLVELDPGHFVACWDFGGK